MDKNRVLGNGAARAHLDSTFKQNVLGWRPDLPWSECSGPNDDYLNRIQCRRLFRLRLTRLNCGKRDFALRFGTLWNSNLLARVTVSVGPHFERGSAGFEIGSVLNLALAVWTVTGAMAGVKGPPWVTSTCSRGRAHSNAKSACGSPAGLPQAMASRRAHRSRAYRVWRGCSLGLERVGTKLTGQAEDGRPALFVE